MPSPTLRPGMSAASLDERLDRIVRAFEGLWPEPGPIDPEDAMRAAARLRELNRQIWRHLRTLRAIGRIDLREVAAEAEAVGVQTLIEEGVLRVDRQAWAKWRTDE